MKRSISLVLAILMVASLMTFGAVSSSAATTTLVASGSEWSYVWYHDDGTAEDGAQLPEGWYQKDFDASEWEKGNAPFTGVHYANADANTQLDNDGAKKLTLAAVQKFQASNVSNIQNVIFKLFFDENPVVYINGKKVHVGSGWNGGLAAIDPVDGEVSIKDALVEGENTIAVYMENNINGGGFHMDLSLEVGTPDPIDADGNVALKSATGKGACGEDENGKGGIGAYDNILDGINNNMYGNFFVDGMYVEVFFWDEVAVTEIKFEGKNEGTPNADGISGLVDVYVGETLVADDAYVIRQDLGGYTITFDAAVVGSSVKFAFESAEKWYAGGFTGIADVYVKGVPVEQAAVEGVIEYAGTQGSSDSNAVRFVSSTESLDFDKIGMMISTVEATGATRSWNASSSKVYTTIKSADGDHVAPEGEYYMGAELSGIPEGDYTFTIVPYAKTAGGMVIGEIVSVTVNVTPNGVTVAN